MPKTHSASSDVIEYLQKYAAKRKAHKHQTQLLTGENNEDNNQMSYYDRVHQLEQKIQILEQNDTKKILHFANILSKINA